MEFQLQVNKELCKYPTQKILLFRMVFTDFIFFIIDKLAFVYKSHPIVNGT